MNLKNIVLLLPSSASHIGNFIHVVFSWLYCACMKSYTSPIASYIFAWFVSEWSRKAFILVLPVSMPLNVSAYVPLGHLIMTPGEITNGAISPFLYIYNMFIHVVFPFVKGSDKDSLFFSKILALTYLIDPIALLLTVYL